MQVACPHTPARPTTTATQLVCPSLALASHASGKALIDMISTGWGTEHVGVAMAKVTPSHPNRTHRRPFLLLLHLCFSICILPKQRCDTFCTVPQHTRPSYSYLAFVCGNHSPQALYILVPRISAQRTSRLPRLHWQHDWRCTSGIEWDEATGLDICSEQCMLS